MSEQTTNREATVSRIKLALSPQAFKDFERIARKGGHAGIEAAIGRALTIYWTTLGQVGKLGYAIQLWWPYDDWGDGARFIELARCFQVREDGIVPAQAELPAARTIALDLSARDVARVEWMRRCLDASLGDLLGLALAFYEVLLDHRDGTFRGGWHLRINQVIEVTRRRWLMPWKTYTQKRWRGWRHYAVRRILNEW